MVKDKCAICGKRPAKLTFVCGICDAKIKAQEAKRNKCNKPDMFITYRGHVVALRNNHDGTFKGILINPPMKKVGVESVPNLPCKKTINLDVYCKEFTRKQIKHIRANVLRLIQFGCVHPLSHL